MKRTDEQQRADAAAWNEYHHTMLPAREAFEKARKPAREKLDAALKANKAKAKAARTESAG